MLDYIINPVKMGGLVKEVTKAQQVVVHLHGRLGVITVPKSLVLTSGAIETGQEMQFYFSYIQVVEDPYAYDSSGMRTDHEPLPCLLGGVITEVNDTAAKIEIMDHLGTIAVPRRWLFTSLPLQCGLHVEFYFSPMVIVGKRDIPAESI